MNQVAKLAKRSATRPDSLWLEVHAKLGLTPMGHLFNRLDGAYPRLWKANFPDEISIQNWEESWAEAFDEAALTFDEVKEGIKRVRATCKFPPSIAEFLQACRPPVDPELAYHEAVLGLQERLSGRMGAWTRPYIFWAAMTMRRDLMQQTFESIRVRWTKALADYQARKDLPCIPAPVQELPAPGQATTSREMSIAMLGEAHAMCEKNGARVGYDHLRWARRIAERVAAGDTGVTHLQIREAEVALRYSLHEEMKNEHSA
jgi:hypothetical protein